MGLIICIIVLVVFPSKRGNAYLYFDSPTESRMFYLNETNHLRCCSYITRFDKSIELRLC